MSNSAGGKKKEKPETSLGSVVPGEDLSFPNISADTWCEV